jgi:hypothetical protein
MSGIAWVFVSQNSDVPLFPKVMIGLFALIGLGILYGALHQFLALFNPRIRLTADAGAVPLGGRLRLEWIVEGRPGKLRRLSITLEGREEATYRRGTSTSTDRHVFASVPLVEMDDAAQIASGHATVVVPANSMHTFEARNNKVLWRLRVRSEIPRWPDVDDEYPLSVLPQPRNLKP